MTSMALNITEIIIPVSSSFTNIYYLIILYKLLFFIIIIVIINIVFVIIKIKILLNYHFYEIVQ